MPAAPTVAEPTYRVLAVTDDPAPGTNSTFFSLGTPKVSLGSQVAFFAQPNNGDWTLYRTV